MTDIYLIRHCEAEGNLYRRVQGSYNGLPTARGRRQIDALAERFRDVHIDSLYSSDLTRAMETAGAISRYHPLELQIDPRLRELDMGVWENQPWGNIAMEDAWQLRNFSKAPEKWHVENAESFDALLRRVTRAMNDIVSGNAGKTVAVVSHGMAIRTFLLGITGLSPAEIGHGDNTSVALVHAEKGRFTVEFFNDNSHLTDEMSTFAKQSWWKEESANSDRHNLAIVPLDPSHDRALYIECYASAWEFAHGTRAGFDGQGYWNSALHHLQEDPRCVAKAFAGSSFAGLIDLSLTRGAEDGAGWISLCYMVPELRGKNDSIQLIGHAVDLFREKGFHCMRLHVAEENARAIGFYEKIGFVRVGEDMGMFGRLLTMEMGI